MYCFNLLLFFIICFIYYYYFFFGMPVFYFSEELCGRISLEPITAENNSFS